jgi:hypothetical protein
MVIGAVWRATRGLHMQLRPLFKVLGVLGETITGFALTLAESLICAMIERPREREIGNGRGFFAGRHSYPGQRTNLLGEAREIARGGCLMGLLVPRRARKLGVTPALFGAQGLNARRDGHLPWRGHGLHTSTTFPLPLASCKKTAGIQRHNVAVLLGVAQPIRRGSDRPGTWLLPHE